MIDLYADIEEEQKEVAQIDDQVEHQMHDKLMETVFKPFIASKTATCIHQSRSITCG